MESFLFFVVVVFSKNLLIAHGNQSVLLLRSGLLSEISFPVRAKKPPEKKIASLAFTRHSFGLDFFSSALL